MGYFSTADETFYSLVEQWLTEQGEISALFYYSWMAGSKDFVFFHSLSAFLHHLRRLPPRTYIEVFRKPQLTLRGYIDEAFIETALAKISGDAEYLIAGLDPVTYGKVSWLSFTAGEGRAELEVDLRHELGERVAFGLYPAAPEENPEVITAIVPEADGSIVIGFY